MRIFFGLILVFAIFSEKIFSEKIPFDQLKEILDQENGVVESKTFELKNFYKKTIELDEDCSFFLEESLDYANFLRLVCGKKVFRNFILFGKSDLFNRIYSFRIEKLETIGQKKYFVIKDIQFHFARKAGIKTKNKNLSFFIENFLNQNFSKLKVLQNEMIYFDRYCPLEFISADSDFHWDKINLYHFKVSCIEPDYILTVELSEKKSVLEKISQKKERLTARVRLKSVSEKKILWDEIQIEPL